MPPPKPCDAVLTPGEWEALIFQTPEQVKPLVMLLAVFHGVIEPPRPDQCPLCGQQNDEAQQKLFR